MPVVDSAGDPGHSHHLPRISSCAENAESNFFARVQIT